VKVYLVTLNNGYFGSAGQSWLSIDTEVLKKYLREDGYEVNVATIDELLKCEIDSSDYVIYTSSEVENVRNYIKDVMFFIDKKCTIIPSYKNLLAHENKGFQQLQRQLSGFGDLKGNYAYDLDDLSAEFPFVLKSVTGAGSSGVFLIKNENKLQEFRRKHLSLSFKRKLIKFIRGFKLSHKQFKLYEYRYKPFKQMVSQSFVANLQFDYKVLVFHGKYYVLKRNVRRGDFRASGSGDFQFEEVPVSILNYAKDIFLKLDSPLASLDLIEAEGKVHLIEYQVTNFGPIALKKSLGYHSQLSGEWCYHECSSDLNEEIGRSFTEFVTNKRITR
jgi:glutathione synthase/RimK-type ligase-like ATP-grasp enzyme